MRCLSSRLIELSEALSVRAASLGDGFSFAEAIDSRGRDIYLEDLLDYNADIEEFEV